MKKYILNIITLSIISLFIALLWGCKRDIAGLDAPSFPNTADVFHDGFTSDLAYAAFGGSDVKAFQVDSATTYGNTKASMMFAVPDTSSPQGSYAGGCYFSKTGRNLTGYNALTFYIKATQPVTIDVIGFGNDLGQSKYQVALNSINANTSWKKVIIPIPDPSKLNAEKGMLFYSASPKNGRGYTFWIDEVKFENLPDLANLTGIIQNGNNDSIPYAIAGNTSQITGFKAKVNLPTGVDETVTISPYYFNFVSSNSSVASVSSTGSVSVMSSGATIVNATLGSKPALGSLKINSIGSLAAPPAPNKDASNVISLLTSVYKNVPVDYWNGYWQPYQNTLSNVAKAGNDTIIQYSKLNFVGAQFTNPTVNLSSFTRFHMDIFTPNSINSSSNLQIQLIDFGANGVYGGGDDVTGNITIPASALESKKWVSIDTLLSSFTGLATKGHLGQMVLVGNNLTDVWIDNVYFWRYPIVPTVAAPVPTRTAANVLSIFSDSYTNVSGTNFNPSWGQTTQVNQVPIAGNNALAYTGFNYQGTQFAAGQDVSSYGFLHLDYYSANASQLKVFLISPGPTEAPFELTVPTNNGWNTIDIPLSTFTGVDLTNVIQMKFDEGSNTGNAHDDIYLDNIYFWKIPAAPSVAAPTPTYTAANVVSIFSDTYTPAMSNIDFFPNWGQSTVVTQTPIAGNNTLLYTNLNYEGTQLDPVSFTGVNVSAMSYLHIDYYSGNSNALQVFLISPGPIQKSYTLSVPTASGWASVDIPLTAFTSDAANKVDLANVFQIMFVGNGTIYLDNILFHK